MSRSVLLSVALGLSALLPAVAWAQANPPAGGMDPQKHAQAMQCMREMAVMMQNTAAWTPRGLFVLQGNRLLHYGTDLRLVKTISLPTPPVATAATPPAGGATAVPSFSSMLPPQILATDTGTIVIVRGQQILRLDQNLNITTQAALPTLPAMTPAEMQATCPMCQCMVAMAGMMGTMGNMQASAADAAALPPAAAEDTAAATPTAEKKAE